MAMLLPWKPNILLIKKFHHFLLYAWFMSWGLETVMQVRKVILRAMLWINWDFIVLFQEWQKNWENYGPWDRNYCSKRKLLIEHTPGYPLASLRNVKMCGFYKGSKTYCVEFCMQNFSENLLGDQILELFGKKKKVFLYNQW